MGLPAVIKALLKPSAYPEACGKITFLQTHISYIFLTDKYAYKIKKPVDFGFLDLPVQLFFFYFGNKLVFFFGLGNPFFKIWFPILVQAAITDNFP